MGFSPQNPSPAHLYSQELQLKLYQAFIFSIPILFSIILFLLFYLFYLKKRVSSISSNSNRLARNSSRHAISDTSSADMDVEEIFKEKLPVIQFDGSLESRETLCCVCLGEFEFKEELHQIPSCKHVFHMECISHWLHSNATCPLCRCSIFIPIATKSATNPEERASVGVNTEIQTEQPDHVTIVVSEVEVCEGSSGSSTSGESIHHDNADESVVIHIQSSNE